MTPSLYWRMMAAMFCGGMIMCVVDLVLPPLRDGQVGLLPIGMWVAGAVFTTLQATGRSR